MKMNRTATAISAVMLLAMLQLPLASAQMTYSDVRVASVYYEPQPAEPGNYVNIYINLYNAGNLDAKSVVFELKPKYPFSLDAGAAASTTQYLPMGGSATIQYRLRIADAAVGGANELDYSVKDGYATKESSLNILVSSRNNILVSDVSPDSVKPGERVPLTFTLQNTGNSTIERIAISWSDANNLIVPIGSGNQQYLPAIGPLEKENVAFDVIADPSTTPGVYLLNVDISYYSGNATKTVSSKVGLIIGGQADIDVSMQDLTNGQLSLAVANIGFTPASAVSIEIPRQAGISVTGANTKFLGNLLKGDYTIATFTILQGTQGSAQGRGGVQNQTQDQQSPQGQNGAAGGQQGNSSRRQFNQTMPTGVRVLVYYTDTLGQRQTLEKQVPINFLSASGTDASGITGRTRGDQTPWYYYAIGGVVVLVIAYFAYKRFKGRKEEKKKQQPTAKV